MVIIHRRVVVDEMFSWFVIYVLGGYGLYRKPSLFDKWTISCFGVFNHEYLLGHARNNKLPHFRNVFLSLAAGSRYVYWIQSIHSVSILQPPYHCYTLSHNNTYCMNHKNRLLINKKISNPRTIYHYLLLF